MLLSLRTTAFSNVPVHVDILLSIDSIGACQGVSLIDGSIYLYGDRETGIVRQYNYRNGELVYNNLECRLTVDKKNVINHPTGIAFNDGKAFMGNSVRNPQNPQKWIAEIYFIDWNILLQTCTLDQSLIHKITDDLAIQGTRPEYVEYMGGRYVATSDYGNSGNEVRLYHYDKLKNASKTSDDGVLFARFKCTPWVQNLHWIADNNTLVLVQNQTEGKKWRLTFLDMEQSLATGQASIINVIDFENGDELEGFCLLSKKKGIAVSSSRKNNVLLFDL